MPWLTAVALRPTARVAHGPAATAAVLLAGIPAVITVIRGGEDTSAGVIILVLVAAVSVAFAVDDPAANLLSSKPYHAAHRRALRFFVVALEVAAVAGSLLAVVAVGASLPDDLTSLAAPAVAAACTASFVALVASSRGDLSPGATGVIAGLLIVAMTAALAVRWPRTFPTILDGPVHERWWVIGGIGVVGGWRAGRDPARR